MKLRKYAGVGVYYIWLKYRVLSLWFLWNKTQIDLLKYQTMNQYTCISVATVHYEMPPESVCAHALKTGLQLNMARTLFS